jgi:hypothetical protein
MNLPGRRATIVASHHHPGETGMKMLTQSLLLAGLISSSVNAADTQGFDVLNSMSVAQFRGAGLDKLSDTQLKALNTWFNQYLQQQGPACPTAQTGAAAPAAAIPAMAAPVAAAPAAAASASDSITAHITGDFHGWTGGTRFTLDNGQVWEQIDDGVVTRGRVTNPKVTITRGVFNSYYMSVEGMDETVQVKRIKP